ncbi:MAG TPA: DEAD/DEAH box helicase family protein [Candidatus Bacteroides merdipullorum]|uniref:DEAD/DEAH box helicase family protein n=1 Tax=Candidatus Bacteroides merdipullorum TaxID=2838474 RepID=A0A9D2CV82_9BACE|nr:DEAD/DEAH box helicase family protein [Candidatus Bacteroides merdipullorum]
MKPDISLELARRLNEQVQMAWADGTMLETVTPVTADLLRYWFTEPYVDERSCNFHEGQRQAILNIVYLHEVLRVQTVLDIYERVAPDLLAEADLAQLAQEKYNFPKYVVKMATGTGKTWVMHALLLWQLLNARREETPSGRYTRHFLVVAPGLIVYDRLLDAYKGRLCPGTAERDVRTNDFHRSAELFLPPAYREEAFAFIEANTVSKEEGIGRKVTGDGLIALTNWHLFLPDKDEDTEDVVTGIFPVRPGTSAGNALDTLDRRYLRGSETDYLSSLPELMVINDEAHHIHELKRGGEVEEVEWQKGLNHIARGKAGRFCQVDFSATPYDTLGTGSKTVKLYFPHIVADFDLSTAMRQGLVKTLLLDKRQELTELEGLDFRAVRDDRGKVIDLSDGQRLMLRAGLEKLRLLEEGFLKIDASKHPKMLVMCEDTVVTTYVEQFLRGEGLAEEEILRIDSNRKGELGEAEWQRVRERLFNVDRYATPRVIVSVLMLREGFDVNNICVIVPLRSSEASILLEQTVGRGLRLMWREPQYREEKEENRRLVLVKRQQPKSYLDMLSIIEHPAFERFYKELMAEGLAAEDTGEPGSTNATGDLMRVGLKPDYKEYDLFWPTVIRDAEEEITPAQIDVHTLAPFTAFTLDYLREHLATKGETFLSEAVMTETRFGRYEVKADLFNARSYNDYLQKLLRTVTTRMDRVGKRGRQPMPAIQVNQADIVRLLDLYIRTRLFGQVFDPFHDSDWKILLSKNGLVTQHMVKEMSVAIHRMQENVESNEAVVEKTWFSSVPTLCVRENYSMELQKVIYERLGYPSHGGGLEKAFMEFLDRDACVERFLKISESQHVFASLYYVRQTDGLLASYHPDFLVCTATHVYVVETKADGRVGDVNVRCKQQAAAAWCAKINTLPPADRLGREWAYILLPESDFYLQSANGATLEDMARLNRVTLAAAPDRLL